MKVMSAEEFARDVVAVLDTVEREKSEVAIVRDHQTIARLVPGLRAMPAREAFAGLEGVLTAEEGEAWLRDIREMDRVLDQRVRDPWE